MNLKKEVKKTLNQAYKSKSWLVMITYRENNKLYHTPIYENFKTEDLSPSVEAHREKITKDEYKK